LTAPEVSPPVIVDTSAPLDGTVNCPEFIQGLWIYFFATILYWNVVSNTNIITYSMCHTRHV